jgi:hypothetical protein
MACESPSIRDSVPQGRDQHHDGGEIDAAAEEAQRWRRHLRPAIIGRTTEAETPVMFRPEPVKRPPRLTQIGGQMQRTIATRAASSTRGISKIAIKRKQQMMKGASASRS